MSFQMNAEFQKHEEESEFKPCEKGQYRVQLENCIIGNKPCPWGNGQVDQIKFECTMNVFKDNGATGKVWNRLTLEHPNPAYQWKVKEDQNNLYDLYQNVVCVKYNGDNSLLPLLDDKNVNELDNTIIEVELDIDPQNDKYNIVTDFNPPPQQASQPEASQPEPTFAKPSFMKGGQ